MPLTARNSPISQCWMLHPVGVVGVDDDLVFSVHRGHAVITLDEAATEKLSPCLALLWGIVPSQSSNRRLIPLQIKVSREAATRRTKSPTGSGLLQSCESQSKTAYTSQTPFLSCDLRKNRTLIVVAFAHHSRKPGYWRRRITP